MVHKALRNEETREEFLNELLANKIQIDDSIQLVPNWELNFLPEQDLDSRQPVLTFQ